MGNRFPFGRLLLSGNEDGRNFWLGTEHQRSLDSHFPSCSDELLDWTFEASVMFHLYLRKGVSRRGAKMDKDPAVNAPESITFIPYVLTSSCEDVQKIPSMNMLDRLRFFAENVMIVVFASGRQPAIVTLQEFLSIHVLLVRYLELLKTMRAESPEQSKQLCSICLSDESKMIVLSCSHGLCTKCHKKWVSRQLNCPFCRQNFQRGTVYTNQWELLEWKPKDAIEDIVILEGKLENAWCSMDFSSTADELLAAYKQMGRTIGIIQDEDGTLIVEKNPV